MGIVIKTNGGLVKTASGGTSFNAKARFEGFFIIVESRYLNYTVKKYDSVTGSEITSFASNLGAINGHIYSAVKTLDNEIIIAGNFTNIGGTSVNRIAKIDSDGNLDTNFNSGGAGFNGTIYSMALRNDGKILVGGLFTSYNGSTCKRICCLNTDGSLNTDFVGSSSFGSNLLYSHSIINIGVDAQDRAVLATSITGSYQAPHTFTDSNSNTYTVNDKFFRLGPDGVFDQDFNDNRALYPDYSTRKNGADVNGMVVDKAGNTYVAWNDLYFDGIIREGFGKINSDGTHNSMSDWEYHYFDITRCVAVQSNGSALVGRRMPVAYMGTNPYTVKRQAGISRLASNGLVDDTFNQDGTGCRNVPPSTVYAAEEAGTPFYNIYSYYGRCDKIFVLPDDSIVVIGYFTYYNHKPVSNIVHLNRNGTVNEASPDFSSMVTSPPDVIAVMAI